MTHDERISSYIDNELTTEQEQEFLISLAASDGLRKSFRSELVMKKVLHADERAANPPRRLRGAVFAAVGLAGASTLSAEHSASAATKTTSAFKALFASKMGALVTTAVIGTSAIVGYGVRTATEPTQPIVTHVIPQAPLSTMPSAPAMSLNTASQTANPTAAVASHLVASDVQVQDHHQRAATVRHHVHVTPQGETAHVPAGPVSGATGGGSTILEPPKVEKK